MKSIDSHKIPQKDKTEQIVVGFAVSHQVEFGGMKGEVRFQFVISPLSFYTGTFSYKMHMV